jgi:hypothetical protein
MPKIKVAPEKVEPWEREAARHLLAGSSEMARAAVALAAGDPDGHRVHVWAAALHYGRASELMLAGVGDDARRLELRARLAGGAR